MKTIIILSTLIFCSLTVFSQNWQQYLSQNKVENGTLTLFDYQEAFRKYCEPYDVDHDGYFIQNGEKHKLGGWKQFKRAEYLMSLVADPITGEFPETDEWTEWKRYQESHPPLTDSPFGDWVSLGPSDLNGFIGGLGRLNSVAFHPDNTSTLWVGAPTGGIWVTYNHGVSWTCLSDNVELMGVSDIIIPDDYSTSNTIYIATGDRDNWSGSSIGVLKSTDGGSTWQQTDLTFNRWSFKYVLRLLKHPSDDETIYAATTNGLYKTNDGGNTFNNISSLDFIDLEFKPGDPTVMYGSTRDSTNTTAIYRSLDSGATWNAVLVVGDNFRTELAVSADEPNWVYAVICEDDGSLLGIYKSVNSGTYFNQVFDGTVPGQNLLGWHCAADDPHGQGGYDLCLAANPFDADELFLGGINTWKSNDGGVSWQINNFPGGNCGGGVPSVHVDHHALVFRPGTTELYECNDGGIYYTTNLGATWTDISDGLAIGQVYRLSSSQTTAQEILAGFQDVSTNWMLYGVWTTVTGGDGTECIINPVNESIQYSSRQNGCVWRTTDHWGSDITTISENISGDWGAWVTPFILDPNSLSTIYIGYTDLWKSTDQGDNFTMVYDFQDNNPILSLSIAPTNSQVICASKEYSFYLTSNGGTSWDTLTSNLPLFGRYVNSTTFKETNDSVLWACLSKYNGNGIYRSSDRGATWQNISAGLPNVPVFSVVQNTMVTDYEELYCATPMGVFAKLGNQDWFYYNTGLPLVWCHDLSIFYSGEYSKLRVGTWGRGVWETDLYSSGSFTSKVWSGLSSNDWFDEGNWQMLEVPVISDTVTIPSGCPNYPAISNLQAYCKKMVVESGATLTIGANHLVVDGQLIIEGELVMTDNSSEVYVGDDIIWQPYSTVNIQADHALITVLDDWILTSGSDIDLQNGYVKFAGNTGNSSIIKESIDGSFHSIISDKSPGRRLIYPASSVGELIVEDEFKILSGSEYLHQSSDNLHIKGSILNAGTYKFDDGTLYYAGDSSTLLANSECYLNDLRLNASSADLHLGSETRVNGDVLINSGTLWPHSYRLHLGGDYNNLVGVSGFVEGTSDVMFDGTSQQKILSDENFSRLTLNNSTGLKIDGGDVEASEYNWMSGSLEVNSGSSFTAMDLYDDGIAGTYILQSGGEIELHSSSYAHIKGDVIIYGGNFDVYGGTGGGLAHSYWPYTSDASLTMSGGALNFHDVGIFLNGGSSYIFTANITGGYIKTTGDFYGTGNFFNPSAGTVLLYGSGPALLGHGASGGFYEVKIDKGTAAASQPGNALHANKAIGRSSSPFTSKKKPPPLPGGNRSVAVTLASNLDVDGHLQINSGEVDISSYSLDIAGNLTIGGILTMNDPAGQLTAENIYWIDGSDANIAEGNIFFKTNWNFNSGTNAQLGGNNIVTASGNSSQLILCSDDDASFANLTINNPTGNVTINSPNAAVRIAGDLRPNSGSTVIINDSVVVGDLVYIYSGADVTVDGGPLITENDLTVQGSLQLTSGEIKVIDWLSVSSSAILTIDDGLFVNTRAYTGSRILIYGTLNLNGGIMQIMNEGLSIAGTNPFNCTGGILKVGGDLYAQFANNFHPGAGIVELISGNPSEIRVLNGNYFNDLRIAKNPATTSCSAYDSIRVLGDLTITSGELNMDGNDLDIDGSVLINTHGILLPGTNGIVHVAHDWTNNRGTAGFVEGNSNVIFDGTEVAYLFTDETFYNMELYKDHASADILNLYDDITVSVTGNLGLSDGKMRLLENTILNAANDAYIAAEGSLLLADFASNGEINITGVMEVAPGGSIILNNGNADFYSEIFLDGNLQMTNSQVEAHSYVFYNTTSSFILNSGAFTHSQSGPGSVTIKGDFQIHDGSYICSDRDIIIHSSVVDDVTGGTIFFPRNFTSLTAGTFNPSGGVVVFTSSNTGLVNVEASNNFHDFTINKPSGQLNLQSNILVNHDFELVDGLFDPLGFDIDVGRNWSNLAGPAAIDMVGVDVEFISSTPAQILSNEDFYRLFINKPLSPGQYLEVAPSKRINVSQDISITDGAIFLNQNDTLDVVSNITIQSGAGLICDGSATGIVIECGRDWANFNTAFDMNIGFNPGLSNAIFDSDYYGNEIGNSGNLETFYDLTIDNPTEVYIGSGVAVLHDLNIMNGYWFNEDDICAHTLAGDFFISSTATFENVSPVHFVGSGAQSFTNLGSSNTYFNEVVIDQPANTDIEGNLTLNSDMEVFSMVVDTGILILNSNTLTCQSNLDVNDEGYMIVNDASTLIMEGGSSLGVNGGTLEIIGNESLMPTITSDGPGNYYEFVVSGGGAVRAVYALFEYMDVEGVQFETGGILHSSFPFYYCTFQNGEPGGQLIKFGNSQTVTIPGAIFPANTWSGANNVSKTTSSGRVTFDPATSGEFAGPAFENDPFNKINWSGTGHWTGELSSDWHTAGNWQFDIMPDAGINVVIPAGKPNDPVVSGGNASSFSFALENGASITLDDYTLTNNSILELNGAITLLNNAVVSTEDLLCFSGTSFSMGPQSKIQVLLEMTINDGVDMDLYEGTLEFAGTGSSAIICNQDSARIGTLQVNAGKTLDYYSGSTGDLVLSNNLVLQSSAVFLGNAPRGLHIEGYCDNNGGHIYANNTHFYFSGNAGGQALTMNTGDYFNDLTIASTSLLESTNLSDDTLRINGNLTINPGPSGQSGLSVNGVVVSLQGNWHNNAGESAFIHGGQTVFFTGSSTVQEVTGHNGFYYLKDNTSGSGYVKFDGINQCEKHLTVNHKIEVADTMTVLDRLYLVGETFELVMSPGGYLDVGTFRQGGIITSTGGHFIANDMYYGNILGTFNISGGEIELHQDNSQLIHLHADITMTDGILKVYGGNGTSLWPANISGNDVILNISGGVIDFVDRGIQIQDLSALCSITENITGGIIRTTGDFYCRGTETNFTPAGGIIELYGNADTQVEISGTNNSAWDLHINKGISNAVELNNAANVANELRIISGTLNTSGNPLNIGP